MQPPKIFINLNKNEVTIVKVEKRKLFDNPAKRFIIEFDQLGASFIEKRDDGLYLVNILKEVDMFGRVIRTRTVEEKRLSLQEAKEIIKSVIA
ncbi:MAG: hypothetical protein H5T50_06400 [Nitrososphaeria archaeon]|nr:hypothetical protein [Nitrososphaeria archaeon]